MHRRWILIVVGLLGFACLSEYWKTGQCSAQTAPMIQAPNDTIIPATMRGCWGMIELDTAEILDPGCGGPFSWTVITPFDTLTTNGGKTSFRIGTHDVVFRISDNCGSTDEDTMMVTVIDSFPPIAHCVGIRTVSLNSTGMAVIPAQVFDGGSEESCFIYYKVKRRLPDTQNNCTTSDNPDFWFDDEVKFCCTDMGDTIDVVLRVYDRLPPPGPIHDTVLLSRSDSCIARIVVLDKAPPEIVCPPNITIECGDHIDFDTLPVPTYVDNCDSVSFHTYLERDIDQCGTGEIRRVIVGTDGNGLTDTCIQTITVLNNHPFDGNDTLQLKWPAGHVTVFDCLPVPDTSASGGPVVYEDFCSLVSVSWEDEVFQFSRGACSKVIRTWKVVDWCQYHPKVDSRCLPENGCWTFEQIIKVMDTLPPAINHGADTMIAYLGPGCDSMFVSLDSATTDRCYPDEEILLWVEIDFDKDGMVDRHIDDGRPMGMFPIGRHCVVYIAKDACGNITRDTQLVEIKDRVLPTPIAKVGISTSVIDMGAGMVMVTVNAEMLNASSYDNCTDSEDLIFSFSQDTTDTQRIFNCDSLGVRNIHLWVTDACGNQDYARTYVLVDDPMGLCPTNVQNTQVSGLVSQVNDAPIPYVSLDFAASSGARSSTVADEDGQYMMQGIPKHQDIIIQPSLNSDPIDGLSVKDLLCLHQYLLGRFRFEHTYQFLAADVDMNGLINTRDISQLRKLLLGKISELPHGREWIFIPSNFSFQDTLNPLGEVWPSDYRIANIADAESVDFRGFRLGDLDLSNANLGANQYRNSSIQAEMNQNVDEQSVIRILEDAWVEGVQMNLRLSGGAADVEWYSDLLGWTSDNLYWNPTTGELRMVWTAGEDMLLPAGGVLLGARGPGVQTLSLRSMDGPLGNYLMVGGKEWNLQFDQGALKLDDIQIDIAPNPFNTETMLQIYTHEEEGVQITIRNILGTVIHQMDEKLQRGWNSILLKEDIFPHGGIYLIGIESPSGHCEQKVVKG